MRSPRVSTVVGGCLRHLGHRRRARAPPRQLVPHPCRHGPADPGPRRPHHATPTPSRPSGRPWVVESWLAVGAVPGGREPGRAATACRCCTAVLCASLARPGVGADPPGPPAGGEDHRRRRAPGRGDGVLVVAPAAHRPGAVRRARGHGRDRDRARRGRWCRSCGCGSTCTAAGPSGSPTWSCGMIGPARRRRRPGPAARGCSGSPSVGAALGALNPIGPAPGGLPPDRDHAPPGLRPHRRVAVAELLGPRQRRLPGRGAAGRGPARGPARHRRGRPRRWRCSAPPRWPASRNVPVAALVVTPVLARGLAGTRHPRRHRAAAWSPPPVWSPWLALGAGAHGRRGAAATPPTTCRSTRCPR